jgi:carbon monoxide dehydrogenase subunit G
VIELENEFRVPADPGAVYDFLLQLEQVGQCIPGGRVGSAGDNGAHPAEIVVKLGPMRLTYRGSVRFGGRDQAARKATLTTDMREARGQGSATARMEVKVEEEEHNGARVLTRTEVQLTGRAASMGRGVIDDVAARMVDDMAACITERVGAQSAGTTAAASSPADTPSPVAASATPPAPPAPVSGLRLMARVLWARVKRLFMRR